MLLLAPEMDTTLMDVERTEQHKCLGKRKKINELVKSLSLIVWMWQGLVISIISQLYWASTFLFLFMVPEVLQISTEH